MISWKSGVSLMVAVALAACSAGGDSTKSPFDHSGGGNGAGAGSGAGASGPGNGGDTVVINPTETAPDGATCGVVQKPEQIIQYAPVALFLMQDRTGSMVSGFPGGCSCSWQNSTDAITQFVNDPASVGLDIGLGFFGGFDKSLCDGSDCGTPAVPIGPIAQTAQPIVAAMNANTPIAFYITPLECGLRGMINTCEAFMAQTGERCVAVFVSDGDASDPTPCDPNVANLVQIVADGLARGVTTYALGLAPGAVMTFLNQIAQAGGTGQAFDATGGTQAFISALNAIRGTISVGTALPCQWTIPPPKDGQLFDPAKVNVSFTPQGGARTDFGYVAQADCPRASNAWYFDDPNDPKEVLVCPSTCDMLKASSGAEVDVSFGCDRIPAIVQ